MEYKNSWINEKGIEISVGKGFGNLWWVQVVRLKTEVLIRESRPFKTRKEAIKEIEKYMGEH